MLTLFTLTISGALFMAVFNDKLSMRAYMDQVGQHFGADISLNLARPYRIESVTQTIRDVPGIQTVEAWSGAHAEVLDMQGNVLINLQITAPPADGALLAPQMSVGRWLMPGDEQVIVISEAIQEIIPGLEPGDTLRMSLAGGREEEWLLVGLFSFPNFADDLLAYSPYASIAGIQNTVNHAAAFRLATSAQNAEGQESIASALEKHLRAKGIDVASIETGATMRETSTKMIGIFITLLMIMAVLTAIVGSIGLTGTMGMNVLERTREIGIARAIGATDKEIRKSVVIESALIGLISWALAVPVSFPISYAILQIISTSMKIGVISLIVTPQGMIIWLGVVLVLTLLASILPARNASRLTIREVLAYE